MDNILDNMARNDTIHPLVSESRFVPCDDTTLRRALREFVAVGA